MDAERRPSRLEAGERWAPLTGVAAVVLWAIGFLVIEGFGDSPSDDAAPAEILRYFEEDEGSLFLGGLIFMLGTLFFVWFAGSLRSTIAALEGASARLASIAFAGAVMKAVFDIALLAPQLAGAFVANESDAPLAPEAAQALWHAGFGFFVAAEYSGALLLVATAIAILRWRLLPAWLAWASLALALILLIPPIGWLGLLIGIPLWTLATSVLLYLRGLPARETAA